MDVMCLGLDWADLEAILPTEEVFVVEWGDAQVEGLVEYLQCIQRLLCDPDPTGRDELFLTVVILLLQARLRT